jgi:hypothetical protein
LSNEEKTNDYENFEKGMIYMKILKKGGGGGNEIHAPCACAEDHTNMSYYNLCGIGSQHSNISKRKGGWGYILKSLVCKTSIVKVDRNKNVTLNRCP